MKGRKMAEKPDFIDRAVLLKMARHRVDIKGMEYEGITKGVNLALELIEDFVKDVPNVDAVEVVHGRWVYTDGEYEIYMICSECGWDSDYRTNYCPNCGAKMDGGVDSVF